MSNAEQYWTGGRKAHLTAADVTPKKIREHSHFQFALAVMNNAFDIFYSARQMIKEVHDSQTKRSMTRELESAGRTGWGMGINDLNEAFGHLARTGGKWTDDNEGWGSNMGWFSAGKVGGHSRGTGIGYVHIPVSIANFLDALTGKSAKLNKDLQTFRQKGSVVIQKVTVGDQVLPKVGTPEWNQFGNTLKDVSQVNDGLKCLLWLASVSKQSRTRISSEHLGTVLGTIGKVRSAVDNFDKAARAGMDAVEAAAFTAICEGIGAIPVLGSFYQEAFGLIPGIMTGMQSIVDKRNALAARLGVDLRIIK